MPESFRQIIDRTVKEKRFLVVPGAHDALSARIIQTLGFETYFIGGFPAVGARYAVPDVGLKGFGEISACVRDIMAACDLPVFVDCDDGYGDVKNVVHTVQGYERMGVSAILIEDQQWPKRCGHMVGKKVVPAELAVAKIKAACAERINPETWILARTDARAVYDLDEAMRRAEAYIKAGADGIFIEAPRSIDELKRIGRAFDVPQICNPLMGGHTPILSMAELGEFGFDCAVLGLDTLMHAAKAIETVLLDMKSGKFARRNDGMDFEDYKRVVGYDKWEERGRAVCAAELTRNCIGLNRSVVRQMDASANIDKRIQELGDWRGKTLARVRRLIHDADPGIEEEWKWRGVPVWSHDGIVCTGESYKQVVKFTFARGAALKDPKKLFNSSLEGNMRRAIDLREGETISEAAFKQLIREAVAANSAARAKRVTKKK